MSTQSVVADSATTPALFNLPEIPESSTCKQALQVAVKDLAVGDLADGRYGASIITGIEHREWNFSRRPQIRMLFRCVDDGHEYSELLHPDAPLIHNQEVFFGYAPTHHAYVTHCAACGPLPRGTQ